MTDKGQGATTCFTIGVTVISYLQTNSIGLKVTNTAAALGAVVYIPAALFIALRGLDGKFDHAGGEIAFLAVQAALWSGRSRLSTYDMSTDVHMCGHLWASSYILRDRSGADLS